MNWKKLVVLFAFVDFAVLTVLALWKEGIQGMFQAATSSWMSATLTVDLCLALTMVCVALYKDAKAQGRSPWPFLLLTAGAGSIGPLLYLLLRPGAASTEQSLADPRT
jgi:hypothetical protein